LAKQTISQHFKPEGGYYIVVNMDRIRIPAEYTIPVEHGHFPYDFHLCWFFVKAIGVAAIPVSIFYRPENSHMAANLVRFSVAKENDDLDTAMYRLRALKGYMHHA
jgi:kynurenine aminotransferase